MKSEMTLNKEVSLQEFVVFKELQTGPVKIEAKRIKVQTSKISESGVMGDPTKATVAKGKKMREIMIAHLVKFIEEIKQSKLEELYQKRY